MIGSYKTIFPVLIILFILVFQHVPLQVSAQSKSIKEVEATIETATVDDPGDAADDPAIWIHPTDPSKSIIIGTNKKMGLMLFSMDGKLIRNYALGRINNVDIRQGVRIGSSTVDIVAGSNRTDTSFILMAFNPADQTLSSLLDQPTRSRLGEVYGFCLYHDKSSETLYAIITGTGGNIEQWALIPNDRNKVVAKLVQVFSTGSKTEGCVVDDEFGILYAAEESVGIWKIRIKGGNTYVKSLVDSVQSKYLKADIEGVTIFKTNDAKGYLIVSSQGNNTYAVYERSGNNKYLGSFKIIGNKTVDKVSETDGIDVTGVNLGTQFPSGIFIAQDGLNKKGRKRENQNFKVVSWENIAKSFDPPLFPFSK